MPSNPTDVARLGSRYQVRLTHDTTARTIVASRIQRLEPTIRYNTEVYYELGTVDPVGYAQDQPEFTITFEENVHNLTALDLLLAGKAAGDTSWDAGDYICDSKLRAYLLERDAQTGAVAGELEFQKGVLSEVQWNWSMGAPITGRYTMQASLGMRWTAANAPHQSWGTQDTTSAGGVKIKDARLFLGHTAASARMYRLQSFNVRVTFRTTPIREAGTRATVGYIQEPPETFLDFELNAADGQPDEILMSGAVSSPTYQYYDYVNPVQLAGGAGIRVYDPSLGEGASVLRAWKLETMVPDSVTPIVAQVRGVATKRYSMRVPKATTSESGGVLLFKGDIT